MKHYDVIVIGTGAANIILEAAMEKGLSCAQIERGKFGGTCLTRGCIPTKVMVTAADRIREIEEAGTVGVEAGKPRINWNRVKERVWKKIDESLELREFYLSQENLDVYEGEGYFTDKKTLRVKLHNGELSEPMTADKIFIAVGGRTNVPSIEGLEETGYLTSETLFGEKYPEKPFEELIVLGGGAIGTEFAHIFAAAGTKVSIVQRNVRLLPKEDEEISEQIYKELSLRGVDVHLNQQSVSVRLLPEGKKELTLRDKSSGEIRKIAADEILVCPGIVSNADSLHLEKTDVAVDEKGWIITDLWLKTTAEGIWACGDVNGKQQFRHKANYEADILAYNLFLKEEKEESRRADYSLVPAVTFTYPQVAHIGLTEKQAKEAGRQLLIGRHRYAQTAKGYALGYLEEGVHDAFAKLIVDKSTGDLLGMHIIGPEASLLIQPYVNLMSAAKMNLPAGKLSTVRQTMVPHPALSEAAIWTYYYMQEE
ncbi:MAG: FAD-dependent oxidoreductase [Peptostreptococcaceae bacterium]|nr:FAD-dependent oxidoreductase [Peptostreptococcaceae bacterium]